MGKLNNFCTFDKDISKVFDKEIISSIYAECKINLRSNNQLTPLELLNYLLNSDVDLFTKSLHTIAREYEEKTGICLRNNLSKRKFLIHFTLNFLN